MSQPKTWYQRNYHDLVVLDKAQADLDEALAAYKKAAVVYIKARADLDKARAAYEKTVPVYVKAKEAWDSDKEVTGRPDDVPYQPAGA